MLTIYTAIFGGRDRLHAPQFRAEGLRYLCFTDGPHNVADGVETIVEPPPSPCPIRAARYHKLHPPPGDTLWLDGAYQLLGDPRPLLSQLDSAVAMCPHPQRSCAYAEAAECAVLGLDDPAIIARQIERYHAKGFPENFGLWETGALFRRGDCPRDWQELWWHEICHNSRRDQISLPWVLWKSRQRVTALPGPRWPGVLAWQGHIDG